MRYSQDQLNAMAEKIDIVEYIGQTEEVHRRGNNYFCCCPFHSGDDTPSLCIYPESHRWYCFGCDAGSSIYDWVMRKNNIGFSEAVELVASLTDSPLEETIESKSISVLKELKRCKEQGTKSINQRVILDWQSDYLDRFSDEIPQEWLNEDMTVEALKVYNIRIDHNANRIVYPVFDSEGYLIGVKGRTRLSAYKDLGISKYMNYYKVGQLDYFAGWQQAIPAKSVIIFEGIKSCIKAWGWGVHNTIASETSKLSDGQLKLLIKNGFHEVIFGWDTDQSYKSIVSDPKIQLLRKFTQVSVIRDTHNLLGEKMAPVDKGEAIFRQLLKERIRI